MVSGDPPEMPLALDAGISAASRTGHVARFTRNHAALPGDWTPPAKCETLAPQMDPALLTPDLLAPGDQKSAALDPAQFSWTCIRSINDPHFETAYAALWAEFGAANEMETRDVLGSRFGTNSTIRYEMVLAQKDAAIAAIRDHTAIWFEGEVVVHLSHLLVTPEWRRSGLAGWMRTVSILAARHLAAAHGRPDAAITLVGEMEYDDGGDPRRTVRLTAYERAGFLKIAPASIHYFQPDFRPPAEIDASGGARPLPFQLIIRQIGRESETTINGERVRRLVRALYTMYGAQFRSQDMAHPSLSLATYPAADATVALLAPTSVI